MAHNVETMAYTNEVPWHGLGEHIAEAPTVDKMLKAAKLDWEVTKEPLFHEYDTKGKTIQGEVDGYYGLIRSSDHKCLDVVGNHYKPVQNKDAFEFFKEFVEAGDAKMETAGSLRGGRYVWGLANLQESFKLANNDEVKGYLLVASPHEGGKAMVVKFTTVRVVCNNTLTLALRHGGNEFRMAHRVEFDESMRKKAKEVLGIAREQMEEFEENARSLKAMKMSREDAIEILANVYQPQAKMKELIADFDVNAAPNLKRVMDILEFAPGADPKTGWGVLNAVTYFADHVASRTADKRLTNAWFGKTANHKQMVLNDLLRRVK